VINSKLTTHAHFTSKVDVDNSASQIDWGRPVFLFLISSVANQIHLYNQNELVDKLKAQGYQNEN
jgi:hypothetical protein